MELILQRNLRTVTSTISGLSVANKNICFVLEDVDRGLRSTMSAEQITAKKVHGKTAIPTGRYEVQITFSNHFNRLLPILIGVPGYEGIRIHPGNTALDTEGCLLPGLTQSLDFVGRSKEAFEIIYNMLTVALKKEKVFITVQ